MATTFINKGCEESVLLDLKHLLIEAKQKLPPFLAAMESENEKFREIEGEIEDFYILLYKHMTCTYMTAELQYTCIHYLGYWCSVLFYFMLKNDFKESYAMVSQPCFCAMKCFSSILLTSFCKRSI